MPMPERVASIDVGSNAIRFLAAEPDARGGFLTVAEARVPVRLGHGVFTQGRIDPEAAALASDGLLRVAEQIKELAITRYRAVATSAVRDSRNSRPFVRQIREKSGIRLEVISGAEEMRLVHRAVRRRLAMGQDTWAMVELGGGSVEIALADESRVTWSETHAMGAVRLMETFAKGTSEPREFSRLVQEYVATIRVPPKVAGRGVKGVIATGGNIESIAKICGGDKPAVGVAEIRSLIDELSGMSPAERQAAFDLRPDRADVIVPAAIVYAHLAERFGAGQIMVPGGGLREGIVLDLLEEQGVRAGQTDVDLVDDAVAFGRRFRFDEKHALQVAKLAASLFDQLTELHGMGPEERRLLTAAALLHDVGGVVSLKSHHKHAMYLIARSELPGFSARDLFVTGCIARYHRKAPPSHLHREFAQLLHVDRHRVRVLAGILRIADALDKEHRQKIQDLAVVRRGTEVQIRTAGADEILLEQWAVKKKDDLFCDVFGVTVTVCRDGECA